MNRYTPLSESAVTVCDIETLGLDTNNGSVVVSIGLATIKNKMIVSTKEWLLDINHLEHSGFGRDDSTIEWHAKLPSETFEINFREGERLAPSVAIKEFSDYVTKLNETEEMHFLVGNSPDFDFGMLGHYLNKFDIDRPWKYFQLLDFRTLATTFGLSKDLRDRSARFASAMTEQYPHNALYDAVYEAAIFVSFIERSEKLRELDKAPA